MKRFISGIKPCSRLFFLAVVICLIAAPGPGQAQTIQHFQTGEEFSGPFASWKNVKTDFGAVGDGVTNDAPAINAALAAMRILATDSANVLYFPAGTYLINDSLINPGNGYDGLAIIGEDPATTIISWGGPVTNTGAMLNLTGWYLRVSRLTFEGNNNVYQGIFKTGGFSTHNEFSDLVFRDFRTGVGLDFGAPTNGQAENAIIRCTFLNCSSGIASCNWNSLDQWVWYCLFDDCNFAINQCIGYFQIYNNVFLNSKTYDIGSSPYKNVIANNISINSKCFYAGYEAYLRGNRIYSNVDSFTTGGGSNTVMLDNIIRATADSLPIVHVGSDNMFVGNTISCINSKWKNWPVQPPRNQFDHGLGSNFNIGKPIEMAIDGNPVTSFATTGIPAGIKWNCPVGTQRTVVRYTVSAPPSNQNASPINFELLGSNNWGYSWDILDFEGNQAFTGGGNPNSYPISNTTPYNIYELLSVSSWISDVAGGRSIVNTGAQAGTYCEQIVCAPYPRNVWQNVSVTAGTSYTASGWMKSNALTTEAYVLVFWYNTSYPAAGVGGYPAGFIRVDTIGSITGTNAWTNYTSTLTAPAGAQCAQFYMATLSNAGATGTAWFDAFSFTSAGAPLTNLLLDPGFEQGQPQQWFEVNEFTLLDAQGGDLTKDSAGFVSGADESWGQYYPLDNSVVDTSAIAVPATVSLPATPQNLNRTIFEVAKGTGNDAREIQSKIDSAAMLPLGNKPVVHIPYGQFTVNATLSVPAGSDMQIVGDGLGTGATTRLVWSGNQIGPLMICQGPSRVTIKDLLLSVPYASYVGPEALVIADADQPGGRIFGNQFNAGGPQWTQPCGVGLLSDGLESSDITMICFYPGYGDSAMVEARGGPVLAAGGHTSSQMSLLAGATGDCQNLFSVSDGGKLDAEGMWNEGDWARTSGLVNLDNTSGNLSVACMSWNLIQTTPYPMVNTDNFSGTLTLLLNHFNQEPRSWEPLTGSGSNCNVLSAYNDYGTSDTTGGTTDSTWQDMTSPNANSAFIGNTITGGGQADVVVRKVHNVLPDSTSVLNELAQLRAVRTDPPNDRAPGVTDVKLFRVSAWGTQGHVGARFISTDTSSYTAVNTAQPDKAGLVTLYPTIVQQYYTVCYTLPQAGPAMFAVYDVLGNKISEMRSEASAGNNQMVFSAGGLSAGSYFLKFQSGSVLETKKFIIAQ